MFKKNAIFLLVISALLIPLIFLTAEIISLATLILIFIVAQVLLLYLFYKEEEPLFEHWYAFWAGVLGLGFMLVMVLRGRDLLTELLGLLLFLIYFIGLLIILFKGKLHLKAGKKFKKEKTEAPKDEEGTLESFRRKDEMEELVDFFEPGKAKQGVRIVELEEPKIEKIVYDRLDDEGEPEEEEKTEDELAEENYEQDKKYEEEWKDLSDELPKSIIFDYDEEKLKEKAKPKIRELREAPKVDFEKVKKHLDRIGDGVKNISDRIKLISEKAILEGADKKIREMEKKRQPKPKKSEIKVFASKTGTKFHYKRSCLGLGRVKNSNMITYANSGEARKKGLKACGMCK